MIYIPKTIRACEIVSRLKNDKDETIINIEELPKNLADKANCIKEYAYIIHNKDIYTTEDEAKNPEHKAGTLKPEHIHLIIRFKRNQPQQFTSIAKWFDIPQNFVSNIHGKFTDAILYLTHANAPDKYQYNADEIVSNFNVETIIEHEKNKSVLDEVLQKILSGEIREYNKTLEIDNLMLVYEARKINEAFKIRSEYLQATQKERQTTVIYICGQSGSGKTTLAKKIANEKGLDYFISSGSNDIMDGYCQQPCLILDDVRPSCLGLSDLLKLLDPYTASSIKSRYKNKYLNAELIILTSVLPIEEFYHNVFENENEPIQQLKRRCQFYIKMNKSVISIQKWDDLEMKYSKPIEYFNDTLVEFEAQKIANTKTTQENIEELLPFLCGNIITRPETFNSEKTENYDIKSEIISDKEFNKLFNEEV